LRFNAVEFDCKPARPTARNGVVQGKKDTYRASFLSRAHNYQAFSLSQRMTN
jgi:hypothetical protein